MAAGCGGDSTASGGDWAGTVTDSAGVAIVENPVTPAWSETEAWRTEEVLSIGEAAGDAEYQFGQIAGVGVVSDGRILVLDQQAQRVQVYSPEGAYQESIGRPGSGPGEFGPGANSLFVGRSDTVLIPDLANQRINVIALGGEATSFAIQMERGIPLRFDMLESGDLVAQRRSLNLPNQTAQPNDIVATQAYDGTLLDTLLTPRRGESFSVSNDRPQFRIFAPEPIWTTLTGGRIAFAVNNTYTIEIYGADGSLERIVTRPYESLVVSDGDDQKLRSLIRAQFERGGMPPAQADIFMQGVSFADHWPAFTQMRGGPDGTLWIQRVQTLEGLTDEELENFNPTLDQGSPEWDVFDRDGRYLGIVELPDRFTPFTVVDDVWYGVYRDDLDVQYVRALRVSGARGS